MNQRDAQSTLLHSATWGSTFAHTLGRSHSGEYVHCHIRFNPPLVEDEGTVIHTDSSFNLFNICLSTQIKYLFITSFTVFSELILVRQRPRLVVRCTIQQIGFPEWAPSLRGVWLYCRWIIKSSVLKLYPCLYASGRKHFWHDFLSLLLGATMMAAAKPLLQVIT